MNNEPDLFTNALGNGKMTRVLFLDTETTGPDPETASTCEVAFLLSTYEGFSRLPEADERLGSLVLPADPVPPEASAVHHITNGMLEGKPAISDLKEEIGALVRQADILCAHNLPYDLCILARELPETFGGREAGIQLDSLRLARHLWPLIPSHSLQALRYRFQLDSEIQGDAHRAMFDTELVRSLVEMVLSRGLVDVEEWRGLVDYTLSPLEVKVFSFGKYRGKLVEDIAAQDRDYMMWLLKQKWVPQDYPDLYHTILEKTGRKEVGD
ncbi:MAG: hypothetical protein AVO35_09350 [Candidatus Aegiribacteria sp. MLS_C]|nr:MAG: hypothetical protein AVO35_09350 [Candidatus Aegiribacteria sp. MLS_C]